MGIPPQSRRQFLKSLTLCATAAPTLLACSSVTESQPPVLYQTGGSARLTSRPKQPTVSSTAGIFEITPGALNDGYLVIPPSYSPSTKIPLVLGLHGGGDNSRDQVNTFGPSANARGFALLAVGSRGLTWDAISYKFSYDVAFIDHALSWAFDRVNIDPTRVTIEGFSDGASYTLGLALANGDLFSKAVAFSPAFITGSDSPKVGKPKFFESHGRQDAILPIDTASRRIVPALQADGYEVVYEEFDGGHEIPPNILNDAVNFIMA